MTRSLAQVATTGGTAYVIHDGGQVYLATDRDVAEVKREIAERQRREALGLGAHNRHERRRLAARVRQGRS